MRLVERRRAARTASLLAERSFAPPSGGELEKSPPPRRRGSGPGFLSDVAKNALSALAPLRESIERVGARRCQLVQGSERPFELWQELRERTEGRLDVSGREVLELGPGRSLGMGLIFLAAGARRVVAVDRYRHLFWDDLDCNHLRGVLDRLEEERWPYAQRARSAVRTITTGHVEFDPDALVYRQADGAALPLESDAVDLCYSNAVLEHVHEPAVVVRELARVIRPGGDSIHEIDFRDHFDQGDRLRLLTFPEWEWQARTRFRPGYTNRWRRADFLRAFAAAGFEHRTGRVTNAVPLEAVEAWRPRMVARFRDRPAEDLSTLSYWGWWTRNEPAARAHLTDSPVEER